MGSEEPILFACVTVIPDSLEPLALRYHVIDHRKAEVVQDRNQLILLGALQS